MGRKPGVKSANPPIAKVRKENEEMKALLETGCRCAMCGKVKDSTKFYLDTDPRLGGNSFTRLCRECARAIAHRRDEDGHDQEPTKESVIEALEYLNKPFIESLWNASIQESENMVTGKARWSAWNAYIKNVQMVQYVGMTYRDSDHIKNAKILKPEKSKRGTSVSKMLKDHEGMDTYDSFQKNKDDVIRLLDYDPFEAELANDQPFLYAQLLMLIDSNQDQEMDMIRVSSAISITRGFLQASKLDDAISKLMCNTGDIERNSATIKSLQDAKQKVMSMITSLAAESCLSLKNSKTATRGDNTWTGRIKKIADLNLRESEINGFDIETCKAMEQVMDISNRSILRELRLDESDWSDMVAQQREVITELQREREHYKEISRILLRENLDLKDAILDLGVNIEKDCVNLEDLFSRFSDDKKENEEVGKTNG